MVGFSSLDLHAQGLGAAIQGTVADSTGAVIPGASITVTNVETNLQRTAASNNAGLYIIPSLPPGKYRVQVAMTGFQTNIRENVDLVVGQELVLNTALQIGEITQQVTVTGEAPVVNTTTAQVSGLVGERQVKDLPLNGRSFDNLIALNPGAVNSTAIVGGASSSSGPGHYFAVAGRRPGENVFLLNGVEYPGGSGAVSSTPGGVSGQLLGIDAVREFNVIPNIDSAEYGHRAGGLITIVTTSGTNQFHGALFEFLRNSDLDARNFFDLGTIPPFKRNQFGGAAGGPIQKDKTFIFGNYEGFRQRLGLSSLAVVPDLQARQGLLPNAQGVYQPVPNFNPAIKPYLALWPEPNGQELLSNGLPTGTALAYTNPPNPVREDFGTARADRTFSDRDTLSGFYTVDDGESTVPGANPYSVQSITQRAQVISLNETHIFSPSVVNSFVAGLSRVNYHILLPVSIKPPGVEPYVAGGEIGQIKIGGGQSAGASLITFAGSGPGTGGDQVEVDNMFTYENQLRITRSIHSLTVGVWFERLQTNKFSQQAGQTVFADLVSFLQAKPDTLQVAPVSKLLPWRSWMGAWYVEDAMKLRPNLTVSVGLRHEFTNGWKDEHGQAGNYIAGPDGIVLTQPRVAATVFLKNNARWLFGPRAGIAWDPFGKGTTSIRAGFGIAYNLLDNINFCCTSTNPAYATYTFTNPPFPLQLIPGAPIPAGLRYQAGGNTGGIQADAQTPAVVNYRLEVERQVGAGMSLRVAYVGSHGYHELLRADANLAIPVICSAAQRNCPTGLPDGTKYFPAGSPRRNPAVSSLIQFYTSGVNDYNGLQIDLNRRFRSGLAFRANYTFSKSLDNASSLSNFQAIGTPPLVLDTYDRLRDYGLSAFDIRNRFSFASTYELPFGSGKALANGFAGAGDKLVSGWQVGAIFNLQGGFPFTPLLGTNRSRDGDSNAPDRPDMAPSRTLDGIYIRKPTQWVDPTAFVLPLAGTYGNVGRNVLIGPGLAELDLSLFKVTRISERWNLQFRAEFFNLFNRSNFGTPSPIMLTSSGAPASSAGVVTKTATTSRQIQFGMKLLW